MNGITLGIALSSGLVGLIHSLSPSHWLPVVLVGKSKKWGAREHFFGAVAVAAGHVLISIAVGVVAQLAEKALGFFSDPEELEKLEAWAGIVLVAFGVLYALLSIRNHHRCHGHEHHGPTFDARKNRAPLFFLFSVGWIPCVAVLPLLLSASIHGTGALLASVAAFSLGVLVAVAGASQAARVGLSKFDHPLFEHYGDVITGLIVAAMGAALLFVPHSH